MASNVIRIDAEMKKEIEAMQKKCAQETGKWISQSEALRRIMEK